MNFQALITLVFFIAFITLVVWVYRPSRKKDYEKLSHMALEADRRKGRDEQ